MKKLKNLLLLSFVFGVLFSCTIQKRTVNKGYFVQWHLDKKIKSEKINSDELVSTHEKVDEIEINQNEELSTSEITSTTEQDATENTSDSDFKPTFDFQNLTINSSEMNFYLPATECFTKGKEVSSKILKPFKRPKPLMDGELIVNIVLTLLFLGLVILFTILAIKAAAGIMLYVWSILALVAFVIFVTQVIDLIMW